MTMLPTMTARNRPTTSPLEQPVALHAAQQRGIGRHGTGLGLLFHHHRQVVAVKRVAPTGMLPVLLAQQFAESGSQRGMLAMIGADLALERFDRPGLGVEGFVIPAFDGRKPE